MRPQSSGSNFHWFYKNCTWIELNPKPISNKAVIDYYVLDNSKC